MKAIRVDRNEMVDDVAITCDTFRLERIDDRTWWACAYHGDKYTKFSIYANEHGFIFVDVDEDTIGCTDDSKEAPNGS